MVLRGSTIPGMYWQAALVSTHTQRERGKHTHKENILVVVVVVKGGGVVVQVSLLVLLSLPVAAAAVVVGVWSSPEGSEKQSNDPQQN